MLRADALATLYLFRPLRRLSSSAGRVPILMYHSVSDGPKETLHPYYRTVTNPAVFQSHMQHLSENGYTTLRASDVSEHLEGGGSQIKKPVAITFDDGFRDFYTNAFPVLAQYGFTATMYLPTSYIANESREFGRAGCMTWSEVRELQSRGIEFGSHTVTHPHLSTIERERVRFEIASSKETIEQEVGCAVTSFAYPFAFPETDRPFTASLRGMLQEAGYSNGVNTVIGTTDRKTDCFFRKRLPVNSCDNQKLLQAKLDGAYDWLHAIQYATKRVAKKA